jgi:hypothetical protein
MINGSMVLVPCSLGTSKKRDSGFKVQTRLVCGVAGESPASHPLPLCLTWECQWLVGLVSCCASFKKRKRKKKIKKLTNLGKKMDEMKLEKNMYPKS